MKNLLTRRSLTTLGILLCLCYANMAIKCSKDQLTASAQDVLAVVTDRNLMLALQTISPAALQKLEAAAPLARDLVAAIKNGDTSTALGTVNTIFPIIDEVADALDANPKLKAILALANIALHFIINHAQTSTPTIARSRPTVRRAIEYGNRPVWGCELRQDKRCAELVK